VNVRPARADDIPYLAAILAANDEPMDWPDLPGLGWPYLDHLLARARVHVAEIEGQVAGFAGSVPIGGEGVRFVTDLFIDPARQGSGAGRALLAAGLEGSSGRMTFSSSDERALSLYIRAGMRPWWPLLYVEIEAGALGASDPEMGVVPADVDETARWSRAWTAVDRTTDFAHYASLPEASGFVVLDAGAVAAIGWARRERKRSDGRWVDHATLAPDADPVRTALAVLRAAAGKERLITAVPGPHPVVAPLLERGARIAGRDQFCATDPNLVDPVRLLPNPGFL
jgi:GNAT superfamily N-acetyltransferase